MPARYRIERALIVLLPAQWPHGDVEVRAMTRSQPEDHPMLTRAKFLRLSGVSAATLAATPLSAHAKSNDGVVRVKSAYGFAETIEKLKKDIAGKGIMFFSEIDQTKLAAAAGIK